MREKKKDKTEKNWKENKTISEAMDKLENKRFRSVVRWVFEIAVTLAFAALVAIMLFQSVTMQESSMEPTLSVGDKYFVNRLVYNIQRHRFHRAKQYPAYRGCPSRLQKGYPAVLIKQQHRRAYYGGCKYGRYARAKRLHQFNA